MFDAEVYSECGYGNTRPEALSNTEYELSILRLTQRRGQC